MKCVYLFALWAQHWLERKKNTFNLDMRALVRAVENNLLYM